MVARVLRGGRVESIHRGFGAVAGADGRLLADFGDPETPTYWRSAAKPFQAIPLLEGGGAEQFGLTREEIALACASHDGEPLHAETAARMLARGGFSESDLRCGAHPPYDDESAAALVRAGREPTALHNNCSGKHAAMLLACRLFGFDSASYDDPGHPLQKRILATIAFYSMYPADRIEIAVDGCSLPVFRLPISRLAAAYARLLSASPLPGESPESFGARRTVVDAMTNEPFFISGSRQFTTKFLEAGAGAWIGKEGAEGVYAIGVVSPRNFGIAFKIDDGGPRARFAVALDLMKKMNALSESALPDRLRPFERPVVSNVRRLPVGEIVAAVPLGLRA